MCSFRQLRSCVAGPHHFLRGACHRIAKSAATLGCLPYSLECATVGQDTREMGVITVPVDSRAVWMAIAGPVPSVSLEMRVISAHRTTKDIKLAPACPSAKAVPRKRGHVHCFLSRKE